MSSLRKEHMINTLYDEHNSVSDMFYIKKRWRNINNKHKQMKTKRKYKQFDDDKYKQLMIKYKEST